MPPSLTAETAHSPETLAAPAVASWWSRYWPDVAFGVFILVSLPLGMEKSPGVPARDVFLFTGLPAYLEWVIPRHLTARWPLTRTMGWRIWLRYVVAVLGMATLANILSFFPVATRQAHGYTGRPGVSLVLDALFVSVILVMFDGWRRWRWRAQHAAVMRALTTRMRAQSERRTLAELRALRTDLGSRRIGDALAALRTLIRTDPAGAGRVIGDLAVMLRSLLARATTVIIPIEDEIAALRRVVRLAGASHSRAWREALVVAPDAVDAYVPPLILSTVFDALVSDRDYARTITGWHLHVRRDHAFLALRMQLDSDRDPRLRVPVLSAVLAPRIRGLAGPSATTTVEATSEGLVVTVAVPYADENTDATTVDEIATHTVSATFPVRNLGVTIRYWVFRVAFIALFAVFQRITTTDSVASLVRTMAIFLWCMIGAAIWPLDRKAWQSEGEHRTAWSRYRMWVLVAIAGLAARRIALFDAAPSSAALAIAILESVFAAGIVAVICVAIAMAFNFLEERAHLAVAEQRIAADVDLASQRRAEIELAALKAELNPHWVSNALNAVAGLIERAPDRAERMCDALAALLAEATARVGVQEVSLAEELAGLQPFLTIERERRPDGALTFTLDVPDNVRHARVPSMLLQPAIENAVKHGLMPRGGAGTISVHATRLGDRLQLDVLDDGVGIPTQSATPSARAAGTGIGTHHTLARLDELYGSQATMSIVNRTDGPGAMTRFSLPWHATAA